MLHKDSISVAHVVAEVRRLIIGQLRLGKLETDSIPDYCHEALQSDQYREEDWKRLNHLVISLLIDELGGHRQSQQLWPLVTDCDRLDAIEEHLRSRGILFWQASPCCLDCIGNELGQRIEELQKRRPDLTTSLRGLCFFYDNDLAISLASDTEITLSIGFGPVYIGEDALEQADLENNALDLGREICRTFSEFGFEPQWSGNLEEAVVIKVNWQRRDSLL
jgi:hypothetical protein